MNNLSFCFLTLAPLLFLSPLLSTPFSPFFISRAINVQIIFVYTFSDKGGVMLGQLKTMTECDISGCKGAPSLSHLMESVLGVEFEIGRKAFFVMFGKVGGCVFISVLYFLLFFSRAFLNSFVLKSYLNSIVFLQCVTFLLTLSS